MQTFLSDVCGCDIRGAASVIEGRSRASGRSGEGKVICVLAADVDSSVAALLVVHKAIGDQLTVSSSTTG